MKATTTVTLVLAEIEARALMDVLGALPSPSEIISDTYDALQNALPDRSCD